MVVKGTTPKPEGIERPAPPPAPPASAGVAPGPSWVDHYAFSLKQIANGAARYYYVLDGDRFEVEGWKVYLDAETALKSAIENARGVAWAATDEYMSPERLLEIAVWPADERIPDGFF